MIVDSKLTDYEPANSGTCLQSFDKQQPKKTALRDLQNDNRIVVPNPSCLKDRGPIMEAAMASGIKRTPTTTEGVQSSICNQAPISSVTNGPLVYARRKSEQELVPKINNCEKEKNIDCAPQLQVQSESAKIPCFPAVTPAPVTSPPVATSGAPPPPVATSGGPPPPVATSGGPPPLVTTSGGPPLPVTTSGGLSPFLVKPSSGEPNHGANTSGVPQQGTGDQHWKERFLRLQTHLRNCDGSSQLEYIKMLQSLTPVGRSKHAVELEKRAIQLLLEEGHELMRMKHLNVLGKSAPINSAPPFT